MVEITYGERYEMADLAGKSVAEAREQYKPLFGIPDKAQAKVNGKQLKKKREAETGLREEDELSFAEKSRKPLVLLGASLLTLAITAVMFAFTYTTASIKIGAVGESDYAAVEPVDTLKFPSYVFGRFRGDLPTGNLFSITPTANYTGDLNVKVYLTNADELTKAYQHLNMKLELRDANGKTLNVNWTNTFQTARDFFFTHDGNFDTALSTFGSANSTFNTKLGQYNAGTIDAATFIKAVDTYRTAKDVFQVAIDTYQGHLTTFQSAVDTADTAVGGGYPGWSGNHTAFDSAVTTFNTAATTFDTAADTFDDAIEAWTAGGSWGTFNSAITAFNTAENTFGTAGTTFDTAADTFITRVDALLTESDITSLGHDFQLLTLDNGVVTLDLRQDWGPSPYYIKITGGGYTTNPRNPLEWGSGYTVEPLLYAEVTQR